ncbi:hypothetical protein MC885_015896 [Smutsia gigantea]|nr:hypothetical protein MC885_015896 [Smutsia gigantea]
MHLTLEQHQPPGLDVTEGHTGGQTLAPTLGVWHLQTFNFRVIFLAVTRADNLTPLHRPILASPVPLVMGRGPQVRGPYYPLISQERLGGLSTHKPLLLLSLLNLLPPHLEPRWGGGATGAGRGRQGGNGSCLPFLPHLICSWLVPERGEGAYAPPSPSVLGGVELRGRRELTLGKAMSLSPRVGGPVLEEGYWRPPSTTLSPRGGRTGLGFPLILPPSPISLYLPPSLPPASSTIFRSPSVPPPYTHSPSRGQIYTYIKVSFLAPYPPRFPPPATLRVPPTYQLPFPSRKPMIVTPTSQAGHEVLWTVPTLTLCTPEAQLHSYRTGARPTHPLQAGDQQPIASRHGLLSGATNQHEACRPLPSDWLQPWPSPQLPAPASGGLEAASGPGRPGGCGGAPRVVPLEYRRGRGGAKGRLAGTRGLPVSAASRELGSVGIVRRSQVADRSHPGPTRSGPWLKDLLIFHRP